MKAFIIGSGSFAVSLGRVILDAGHDVEIWCRRPERAASLASGTHETFEGVELPRFHTCTGRPDPKSSPDFVLSVVPTQYLRGVLSDHAEHWPTGCPWVSASKGIELGTLERPSEIIAGIGASSSVSVLSGPSHAEEVCRRVPTAVALGCTDATVGSMLQSALSSDVFRVYRNDDPVGVEWAGALKNVVAIAAGIAVGTGFGDNTLAALVTRGAVEIARIGVALGGQEETFHGLSGTGDLVATCFSEHSRNRRLGFALGRGQTIEDALSASSGVVEGVPTCRAAAALADKNGIDAPITEAVRTILDGERTIEAGVRALLSRSLKSE